MLVYKYYKINTIYYALLYTVSNFPEMYEIPMDLKMSLISYLVLKNVKSS